MTLPGLPGKGDTQPDAAEILETTAASIEAVAGGAMNRFSQCLSVLENVAESLQVPVAVVGGLAAIHHGARVTTLDVDIVLPRAAAEAILVQGPRSGLRVVRESPHGWHQLRYESPGGDVDVHVIPEGSRGPRDPSDAPVIPGPSDLGVESGVDYAAFAPWAVMKLVCGRDKDRYHLVEVLKKASQRQVSQVVVRLQTLPSRYLEEFERLIREVEVEREKDSW